MQKKHHHQKFKNQAGFSLIEMLAVTTILVMLLMTASVLFMNFMISGAKTIALQKLKDESSFAMQTMQQLIVNAKQVTELSNCSSSGVTRNSLELTDRNNQTFTFSIDDDKIASASSATANPFYLTSDFSQIDSLAFTCYTNQNSQYISIKITMSKATDDLAPSSISQTISGGAVIRNSGY